MSAMTRRDRIAMHAMAAWISTLSNGDFPEEGDCEYDHVMREHCEAVADIAYRYADAMVRRSRRRER